MMKIKLDFLIILLIIFAFLLSGCDLYKQINAKGEGKEEGPVYIPIEDIIIEDKLKGTAALNSIEGKAIIKVEGLEKQDNYNYEAWLVDKDSNTKTSMGKFNVDNEGKGELTADVQKEKIASADLVMVTNEPVPDDNNEAPSNIIVLEEAIPETADVLDIKLKAVKKAAKQEEKPEEKAVEKKETIKETTKEEPKEAKETESPKAKEKAGIIIVKETDLVKLSPKATDPDQDKLVYAFTSPLNEKGEWQTNYGDAGEYTITVTVSDGILSASRDVLIIVNKKEESPIIENAMPESMVITAKEDSETSFSVTASDLNKDKLSYTWKLDGKEASAKQDFVYKPGYNAAGSHTVKITVSDGKLTAEKIWSVSVENVNRKPVLKKIGNIKVRETETVTIKPEAEDPDGDAITYKISDPVGDDGIWETNYDSAGTYTLTINASDGVDSDAQTVEIIVENVNRPPVIEDIILG